MPDDPKIQDLDPVIRLWMFNNWIEDQNDDVELVKNHAYLLGSFWNPEAVKKLTGEGADQYTSTDEEFEASTQLVVQDAIKAVTQPQEQGKKKRKRKLKG